MTGIEVRLGSALLKGTANQNRVKMGCNLESLLFAETRDNMHVGP